jgi:hypothetical protein
MDALAHHNPQSVLLKPFSSKVFLGRIHRLLAPREGRSSRASG